MQQSNVVRIFVRTDGVVEFVYDDDVAQALQDIGPAQTTRASHVEPDPAHPGKWIVDLSPLGLQIQLGPFSLRGEALAIEKQIVEAHLAGEPLDRFLVVQNTTG